MSEDRFTIQDVVRGGYCVNGARRWCRENGVDYRDFSHNGMSMERARSFDDVILKDILAKKAARNGQA